jgi:hypothetical protein
MVDGRGELEMVDYNMGSQNGKCQGDDETDGKDVSCSAWNDAGKMRMAKAMMNEELRDRAVDELEVVVEQLQMTQLLLPNRGMERSFFEVDLEMEVILWPESRHQDEEGWLSC